MHKSQISTPEPLNFELLNGTTSSPGYYYLSLLCVFTNGFDYSRIGCWMKMTPGLIKTLEAQNSFPRGNGLKYLKSQLPGNALYILIGLFGMMGSSTMLYVYSTRKRFHHKGYYLFAAMALADFISCFGFVYMGTTRIVQYFYNESNVFHMDARQCMSFMIWPDIGPNASIMMDFVISVDRLIAITKPVFYTVGLGWKYVFGLIAIAYGRAAAECAGYYYGLQTDQFPPICTKQDVRERNCVFLASDMLNVFFITITILNYMSSACAAKLQVRKHSIRVQREFGNIPEVLAVVARTKKMEKFLFKTAAVITISFFFSSLLCTIMSEVDECITPGQNDGKTPYIYFLMDLYTADTVLIVMWKDLYFRKEVLNMLKRVNPRRSHVWNVSDNKNET